MSTHEYYSAETEMLIISVLFMNHSLMPLVANKLAAADFFLEPTRIVYDDIATAYEEREPLDIRSVIQRLKEKNLYDKIGGREFINRINDAMGYSSEVESYADTIIRYSTRRKASEAGYKLQQLAADTTIPPDELLARGQALMNNLAVQRGIDRPVSLRESMEGYYDHVNSEPNPGTPTGFRDLDGVTGGLQTGELTILAARPRLGKSIFALNVADHVSRHSGPVLFVSLEMRDRELNQRLVLSNTNIRHHRLKEHKLTDDERVQLTQYVGDVYQQQQPFYLSDKPDRSLMDIRLMAEYVKHQENALALIVVDYLQLMRASDRYRGDRRNEVSEISRGLKNVAAEMEVPVLGLAQLNRNVEGRAEKEHYLSDLGESGSLEQDANNIYFLHREELYDKETDKKGIAEIQIAKQRDGPTAVVPLRFDGAAARFSDLTYRTPEGY